MDDRDQAFVGSHAPQNGHRFFVIHITTPIRDFDQPGYYWWMTDDAGRLRKEGPYPTAEGAYLAAIGD